MTGLSGGFDPEDFEVDGALRDVCVLGADLPMWERLLEAVAESPWEHRFAVDGNPCAIGDFSVREFFAAREEVDVSARLSVRIGELELACFFFEVEEIEFSFDPAEIESGARFDALARFMIWLAEACGRKAVLTMETNSGHEGMPALLETVP